MCIKSEGSTYKVNTLMKGSGNIFNCQILYMLTAFELQLVILFFWILKNLKFIQFILLRICSYVNIGHNILNFQEYEKCLSHICSHFIGFS